MTTFAKVASFIGFWLFVALTIFALTFSIVSLTK